MTEIGTSGRLANNLAAQNLREAMADPASQNALQRAGFTPRLLENLSADKVGGGDIAAAEAASRRLAQTPELAEKVNFLAQTAGLRLDRQASFSSLLMSGRFPEAAQVAVAQLRPMPFDVVLEKLK